MEEWFYNLERKCDPRILQVAYQANGNKGLEGELTILLSGGSKLSLIIGELSSFYTAERKAETISFRSENDCGNILVKWKIQFTEIAADGTIYTKRQVELVCEIYGDTGVIHQKLRFLS